MDIDQRFGLLSKAAIVAPLVAAVIGAVAQEPVSQAVENRVEAIEQRVEARVEAAKKQAGKIRQNCNSSKAREQSRSVKLDGDKVASLRQSQSGQCNTQSVTIK